MDDLLPDEDLVATFTALKRNVDDLTVVCEARGWRQPTPALNVAGGALAIGRALAKSDAETRPIMPSGARRGNYICLVYGHKFWPLDPRASEVRVSDLAGSLSKKGRFGCHTTRLYTVGEHSFRVAALVHYLLRERSDLFPLPKDLHDAAIRYAFTHDFNEAYLPDIPRPVKASLTGWTEIEHAVQLVCLEFLGLGPAPTEIQEVVTFADNALLVIEAGVFGDYNPYEVWEGYSFPDITLDMRGATGYLNGTDFGTLAPIAALGLDAPFALDTQHDVEDRLIQAIQATLKAASLQPSAVVASDTTKRSWTVVQAEPMIPEVDFDIEGQVARAEAKSRSRYEAKHDVPVVVEAEVHCDVPGCSNTIKNREEAHCSGCKHLVCEKHDLDGNGPMGSHSVDDHHTDQE